MAPAIYPTSVWSCESTQQVQSLLSGEQAGYVYQRERHPNADQLAGKLAELHGAEQAVVTASGMAAMAAAVLGVLKSGARIVVSNRLYGTSLMLLKTEAERLGVRCDLVDTSDLEAVEEKLSEPAEMVVVETISNPILRVADLPKLADLSHARGAVLLVDNTFATPIHCRPMEHGADLVLESVSKMVNGHSDVMLGLLCGNSQHWERIPSVVAVWGLSAPPFDCFLASRGLATLHLRMERATQSAGEVATWLFQQNKVVSVDYPLLESHPDHAIARRVLDGGCTIVAMHLEGRSQADRFISAVVDLIPFAPSLGEICTTLSHPATTSHRALNGAQRRALGFDDGTIRLSIGAESLDYILSSLQVGLDALKE